MRIGAHVDQTDPLTAAAAVKAEAVQFFLGDPQGWKAPVLPDVDLERVRPGQLHPRALRGQRRDVEQPDPHPQP